MWYYNNLRTLHAFSEFDMFKVKNFLIDGMFHNPLFCKIYQYKNYVARHRNVLR